MKVKELIKLLQGLDKEAIINMSSDEEGNSFGDIDTELAEGKLKNGEKVYSLYPITDELAEERYQEEDL